MKMQPEIEDKLANLDSFTREVDEVYEMLKRLESSDPAKVEAATREVDEYLVEKKRREIEAEIAEVRVKTDKTVINNKESEAEKRKRLSEELKHLGNDRFKKGEYGKAAELYTSAILQRADNFVLFTNRAQVSSLPRRGRINSPSVQIAFTSQSRYFTLLHGSRA